MATKFSDYPEIPDIDSTANCEAEVLIKDEKLRKILKKLKKHDKLLKNLRETVRSRTSTTSHSAVHAMRQIAQSIIKAIPKVLSSIAVEIVRCLFRKKWTPA